MKGSHLTVAGIMAAVCAGTAAADQVDTIDLTGMTGGGLSEATAHIYTLMVSGDNLVVDGLEFRFNLTTTGGSWGSDQRMTIVSPMGTKLQLKGADFGWPNGSGTYTTGVKTSSIFDDEEAAGTWTIKLWNFYTASKSANYNAGSYVSVSSVTVPAPSAAAALGLAGLAAARRRR